MHTHLLDLLRHIDDAVEDEDYRRALQLILKNWFHLADPGLLRERTALVLASVGRKREAVEVYSLVARHFANAGFPTRALAAIKQMQNLNPSSPQLLDHFTTLYSVRSPFLERGLQQPDIPDPADDIILDVDSEQDDDKDVDQLFAKALALATDPEATAGRPGSLPALPLLSLLPPKALRRLLDFLEYEIYAETQPIAETDGSDRALYWAVSSDLFVDHQDTRHLLPTGALIGLNAFGSQPTEPTYTVFSQRGSECLRLSSQAIESLTEEFPDFPNRLATLYRHALTEGLFEHHPMFADLDEATLDELPGHLTGLRLDAETFLVRQGKVSPGLYILLDGTVDLVRDGLDDAVDTLHPGDMIGEIGLVDPRPAIASAVTTGPAHVLFFSRDDFIEFVADNPPVADLAAAQAEKRTKLLKDAL